MSFSSPEELWNKTLKELKEKLNVQSYDTWFGKTKGLSINDGVISVQVPNPFFADWLGEHYQTFIEEILKNVASQEIKVSFVYPEGMEGGRQKGRGERATLRKEKILTSFSESQLNERYTFENFVVGKSNEFAYATAMAVAERPSSVYNPLFIYGGVGVGKTHLMQAIGHFVKKERTKFRVYYISSENFMYELIAAIQHRKTLEFKKKYRGVDVLLLDDVHFLAEKEGTQEEIFHTFNSLYDNHKHIVITSDRPPRELINLQDRLVSRFQSGMVADIQPPDLELRMAILKHVAMREGFSIPNDVLYFLAESFESNIRELEGALIRLTAVSSLTGSEISVDFAKEVLKEIFPLKKKSISIEDIQKRVASFFEIPEEGMKMKTRTADLAIPRQVAMYLAREITGSSLAQIGEKFGGKDHATVLHAHKKIQEKIKRDEKLKETIEKISKQFQV